MTLPAPRIPVSASLLWSQRHIPAWLPVSTLVAAFQHSDSDASVWESSDGRWTAQLRRARRGDHVYLVLYRDGALLGSYDDRRGWRPAPHTRIPRRKPGLARQLAFAS